MSDTWLLSRKFILTVSLLGGVAALLVFGKIDAGNYERITIWIAGLYLGANSIETYINKQPPSEGKQP